MDPSHAPLALPSDSDGESRFALSDPMLQLEEEGEVMLFPLDDDNALQLSDVDALLEGLNGLDELPTSSPSLSACEHTWDVQPELAPPEISTPPPPAAVPSVHPVVRRTGAGRKRPKDELASLRRHVAELEEQLRRLSLTRKRPGAAGGTGRDSSERALVARVKRSPDAQSSEAGAVLCALQLWKRIASQQGKMRRGSEEENARLRGLLSAQIRLSRSLERMVRQHPDKMMQSFGAGSPLSHWIPRDRTSLIYASLVEKLDLMFRYVDSELLGAGFSLPAVPQRVCDGLVKTDAVTGRLYIELRSAIVVPFKHDATSAAFWKLYNTSSTDCSGVYQTLEPTAELLRAEIFQKIRLRRAEAEFCGHLAAKRVVESKRTVCVWHSVGESEGELFDSDRVRIRETGWGVIEEIPVCSGSSPITVITSMARMVPDEIVGGGNNNAQRMQKHAATVADYALANFHSNIDITQQILESVILASGLPLCSA